MILRPPDTSTPAPRPVHDWWFTGYDATVTRNDLLMAWRDATARPMPESKSYSDQLKSWSGQVGRRPWAGDLHPTAPTLLTRAQMASAEADGWNAVSALCAELIDPLSRYTAGWAVSLLNYRVKPLPHKVIDVVRTLIRKVPPVVQAAMLDPADDVLATEATVRAFLADQSSRHATDGQTALDCYTRHLGDLLRGDLLERKGITDPDVLYKLWEHYEETLEGQIAADAPAAVRLAVISGGLDIRACA